MEREEYLAHIDSETGREQSVDDHLSGVAELAGEFARVFNAEKAGQRCGYLHDIGKFTIGFQKRLHGGLVVDHATAGVLEAYGIKDIFTAFCIAGHHGGLPDGGLYRVSSLNDGTLMGRIKKRPGVDIEDYREVGIPVKTVVEHPSFVKEGNFTGSFYTRMLFSCLVDADFLDTERFMTGKNDIRGGYDNISRLKERLEAHVEPWRAAAADGINRRRTDILEASINKGEESPGLYSLTVPTGGGKTISSLAFALSHAEMYQKTRIIYVIPYTGIIEQTADVFRKILGRENVIEHHSNVDFDCANEQEWLQKQKLATENWDAPVIVTTAVQFFESLYSYKVSRCRKLHNIVNSVIIFDEAQMMPLSYLIPCTRAIDQLVRHYSCTAVLCTATQPSLQRFFPELTIREICPEVEKQFDFFRRVNFIMSGKAKKEELAAQLNDCYQVLCIVNRRKDAQEIYEHLEEEGSYHLSTLMYPEHRKVVLEEIRWRLDQDLPCRVVSTSLIEAGVDVDFPAVYREQAGLDSVLQAAGRCNREGKKNPEESTVTIFRLEGEPARSFRQNIAAGDAVLRRFSQINTPEAIDYYFQYLYQERGEDSLDLKRIVQAFEKGISGNFMPFQTVGEQFRMIENDTCIVYIPTEKNAEDLEKIRRGEFTKSLIRNLSPYAVNIYPEHFNVLRNAYKLLVLGEKMAILDDITCYDKRMGLMMDIEEGQGIFT